MTSTITNRMFVRAFAVLTIITLILSIAPTQSFAQEATDPVVTENTPVICTDENATNFNGEGECVFEEEGDNIISKILSIVIPDDEDTNECDMHNWHGDSECNDSEGSVEVVATKIVCDSETDLPNWGAYPGGPEIDADTASDWIETHPGCHLQEGWLFQWGDEASHDPGRGIVGEAPEYDTENPFFTFYQPTAANGEVTVTIPLNSALYGDEIHIREVLPEGYIPFTYDEQHMSNADNVSAEIYCSEDVINYDNFDFIRNLEDGATYHCVAWNVHKDVCPNIPEVQETVPPGYELNNDLQCVPVVAPVCEVGSNLLQNASFEAPIPAAHGGDWEIFGAVPNWTISSTGLEIWAQNFFGGPSEGAQNAELDANESTEISQIVPTVVGATYKLSFDFSPRPATNLANNNVDANANGVTVVNASGDGMSNASTSWTTHTNTFVATTTSTVISFKDKGTSDSYGSAIDNTKLCFVRNGDGGGDNDVDTYRIEGNVWDDANSDDTKNEGEGNLAGWTISITNGSTTVNTESDASGNYAFEVPAGTWTITEVIQSGWSQTFPNSGSHIVTVPEIVEAKQNIFLALFVNAAHAAVIAPTITGKNFGNIAVPSSNGGGSSSSHSSSGSKKKSSSGEVLGDSTTGEVMGAEAPIGAPNTGEGGTSPSNTVLPLGLSIVGIVIAAATLRKLYSTKN